MYPNTFFSLFPPFPRNHKVFVAMSFDPKFDSRWENVISPAVKNILINDVPLEPHRVDVRLVSDSILTEILEGISNSRLFLSDVTTIAYADDMPVRNANVTYEVGLAHAIRLPEEVILFRSDKDRLLFDVANIRINHYYPDEDPDEARKLVRGIIMEALNEIELKKHLAIRKATESLDLISWIVLTEALEGDGIHHPTMETFGKILGNVTRHSAITRLLEIGALTASYLNLTPEILRSLDDKKINIVLKYRITPFGEAIIRYAAEKMGMFSPEMLPVLEKRYVDSKNTKED